MAEYIQTKSETEIFKTETVPFIHSLRQKMNSEFVLHMQYNFDYLTGLMQKRDMNFEPATLKSKGPAIVIGSGPSLDEAMPYLNAAREKHGAKIFCTASQVWTMHYNGVTPDYVIQHDPWPRGCPKCDDVNSPRTFVHFKDNGEIYCNVENHHLTGEDRKAVLRGTNIHRFCPDLPNTIVHAHPGVQKEALKWSTFKNNGQLYVINFNPTIAGMATRDIVRGQVIGKASSDFKEYTDSFRVRARHVFQKDWPERANMWAEYIGTMVNAPLPLEAQDFPTLQAVVAYGKGNERLRYPLKVFLPYAPSSTFQNALNAFTMGHNPIYFVGYDLCNWKHLGYHQRYYYDKTRLEKAKTITTPPKTAGVGGFGTDFVKVGEKYALAGYYSKVVNGQYAFPGMEIVEVVCDRTPGNLEFYPRVDVGEWSRGRAVSSDQDEVATRIRSIIAEREVIEGWV